MIEFAFESDAGRIDLSTTGPRGYVFQPGLTGLGLPPQLAEWAPSPAGGGRMTSPRLGMRDCDWPLVMVADTHDELAVMVDRLAAVIDVSASPALVARYDDGKTYRLPFVRTGGGEDLMPRWRPALPHLSWVLSVRCPNPFWVSDASEQIGPIGLMGEKVGLLPDLAELKVIGSSAFGDVSVENPGDAPSPVTWTIRGPGGPVTVELGGRRFVFETPLTAGEVVTIRRSEQGWTVTDQTGASRYSDLGPAPKFPSIPVGATTGSILMTNAAAGSSVAGFFRVYRKVVM